MERVRAYRVTGRACVRIGDERTPARSRAPSDVRQTRRRVRSPCDSDSRSWCGGRPAGRMDRHSTHALIGIRLVANHQDAAPRRIGSAVIRQQCVSQQSVQIIIDPREFVVWQVAHFPDCRPITVRAPRGPLNDLRGVNNGLRPGRHAHGKGQVSNGWRVGRSKVMSVSGKSLPVQRTGSPTCSASA